MKNKKLEKKIAALEFANDQLLSELTYIDHLLKLIGFPEGLVTIKAAAHHILEEDIESSEEL